MTMPTDGTYRKQIQELQQSKLELEKLVKKRSTKITTLTNQISQNILEQRRIEEALRDSNEQYRLLAESAQDYIFIIDRTLIVRYINDFGAQAFRYTPPELMGKALAELFPSPIFEEFRSSIELTFATSQPVFKETIVDFPEKKGVWLETKLTPILDKNGSCKTVLGISRDISDRKLAEEELRQSEHKFRTLAETISAGIAIIKNGRFCYVNQYLLDTGGYSLQELKNLHYLDIVHPDFKDMLKNRHEARLRGEDISSQLEFKIIFKNGKESWVHQRGGIIDFEGAPATLITVWDATEEKNIRNALAAEKERLDVTLTSIGEGVISTDIQANIVTINKVAQTLTGYCMEEAITLSLDHVCCIIDEMTHAPCDGFFKKMIETHGVINFKKHCLLRSKVGSEYQVELSIAPIISHEDDVIGMVLVFSDVTEKLKLESEIFKVRKLESLGTLAGGIAHDFNNILTGIITNLFMAKCTLPQSSENYNLLVDAEKACFRASRLTKQLLTFSKGGAPVKEVASIRAIIEDTVGFCLSGSNATYSLELPDDLLAVNIDKGQIDQVINNLLLNALQAMPSGGMITVKAENVTLTKEMSEPALIRNPSMKPGRYVRVSVIDEGAGIPRKDMEKIFDPYFTTKPKGTGLGLTTSYAIIKNHDGMITVDSEIGHGSVFSFYLPALDVSLENTISATPIKHQKGGKILVMDDDDAVRTVVSQILRGYGYQVLCVASGNETIQLYKEALSDAPFDVVIMDLTIPGGMGGKDVLTLLQDIDPSIKAIVTSGYSNDPIMSDYSDYGFAGVIAKPFVIDDFINVIEKVIEKGE
jgi:PAS domain S-box-containing protein